MTLREIVLLAVIGLMGCSSSTSPSNGTITMTLAVNPPNVAVGDNLTVAAAAVPSGGVRVQVIVIQATGAFSVADSVTVQGSGPQSVTRQT